MLDNNDIYCKIKVNNIFIKYCEIFDRSSKIFVAIFCTLIIFRPVGKGT